MNTVIAKGTVELAVPAVLRADGVDRVGGSIKVSLGGGVELCDVVVRMGDRVLTIKRLLLRGLHGDMLPVLDGDRVVLFTTDDREAT